MVNVQDIKKLLNNLEINLTKEFKDLLKIELENQMGIFEKKIEDLAYQLKIQKAELEELKSSQDFLSKEFDKVLKQKKDALEKEKNKNENIIQIKEQTEDLKAALEDKERAMDELEMYGRRENLEFHGIPEISNENTNEIIKNLMKIVNIELKDYQISTSHRLPARNKTRPPAIIVRFANRDTRNQIYACRKQFSSVNEFGIPGMTKLFINENLTSKKRDLYFKALSSKRNLNYKFIWTYNGEIFVKKDELSPRLKISTVGDLEKM